MPAPTYENFDLAIQPSTFGYQARVLDSLGGTGENNFKLPFDDLTIKRFLTKMAQAREGTQSDAPAEVKKFGGDLFKAVFAGDVRSCWQTSLALSDERNRGLRLRLRLNDTPALVYLPWETLYDASLNRFFNQSTETPLVRYLDLPAPPRPLRVEPPLKILVVISSPSGQRELNVAQEWDNLNAALAGPIERGLVMVEQSDIATLPALQRKMRQDAFHILHFLGHGVFDKNSNQSALLLEDERKQARSVNGEQLGTLLHDHRSLRFVFLNACDGGQAGANDPFSGVAQSLIQQGIPAVIAMQFPITDSAALTFSRGIYSALADNYPLDAALSEARKEVYLSGNAVEWATPVFYSRAPDGVLFDVQKSTGAAVAPPPQPAPEVSQLHIFKESESLTVSQKAASAGQFIPTGKWNIQVQDMVGSRLFVEFASNGAFQMTQQVGSYQVPVSGTWSFYAGTQQLSLQGVVNTFQPFVLGMTIIGQVPTGFIASGSDGIRYLLTRT